jgi:hypothetical protein
MITSALLCAALAQAPATSTEVTVYNQGFGFVKEVRDLNLQAGRQQIAITDLPSQIDPTSVGFKSLTDPDGFQVLEQNYQYDLISKIAILNKSVGKRVRLVRSIGNQREVLEGVLISSPTSVTPVQSGYDGGFSGGYQGYYPPPPTNVTTYNGMVIRADDGRIVLDPEGEVSVEQAPAGLISTPTLFWDLDAAKAGPSTVELSYITQGMNWTTDYVLTLNGMEDQADIQGWVTLTNNSGATYKNARLKLLAGTTNQVAPAANGWGAAGGSMVFGKAAPAFQQQNLFEYHLYTLQRPATIADKEIKQLSLLTNNGVKVSKKVVFDPMAGFFNYYPDQNGQGLGAMHPEVRVEFLNTQENHLGIPLPKGRFRIYERDNSGSVQMLGEDSIEHTPKDEKLSLKVGEAFDVVGSRTRTNFTIVASNNTMETFKDEIRNRKDTPQTVYMLERHWGDWKVTQTSDPWTKTDSNTMQFEVNLKPGEVKDIIYTVETRWF